MYIFCERLKDLRKDHGYDQKYMGERLNISASAYGYYEQGRNEPSLETLRELAQILKVSTDFLLGLSNNENHPIYYSVSENLSLTEKELNVVQAMKKISLLEKMSENPIDNTKRLNIIWNLIHDVSDNY